MATKLSSLLVTNDMYKYFSIILLAAILPCFTALSVEAQSRRASDTYYLRVGQGVSDFSGDAGGRAGYRDFYDTEKFTETSELQYALVAELGYQFTPSFSLGAGYQFGQYYLLSGNKELQTAQLLGRVTLGADQWTISPYVDLGGAVSTTKRGQFAYGPLLGGGFDVAVNPQVSLFVESRLNTMFPDAAADGTGKGVPFDVLGAIPAFGANIALQSNPTPVQVERLDGPESVQTGTTVTYSATINAESASRPIERTWTFGEGKTSSGLTAEHTFEQPGTYTVLFKAENEAGTDVRSKTVSVTEPPKPPHIATLQAAPNPATVGSEVFFRAEVSESSNVSYAWRLGNGTTASSAVTSHTYEDPGTYTVELTVSNDQGETSEKLRLRVDSAEADPDFGPYTVQIGAFTERENAERKALRVLYDGYPTRIRTITMDGQTYYRVWAGSFESEQAAERILESFTVYAPDAFVKKRN